jgi:hypothetical protein
LEKRVEQVPPEGVGEERVGIGGEQWGEMTHIIYVHMNI